MATPKKPGAKRGRPPGAKDKHPRKPPRKSTQTEINGPVTRKSDRPLPAPFELPSQQSIPPLPPIRLNGSGRIVPTDDHRRFVFDMTFIGLSGIEIARFLGISEAWLLKHFRPELDGGAAYRMQEISQALQDLIALRNPAVVNKLIDHIHKIREAEDGGSDVEPRLEIVDVTPGKTDDQ